MATKLFKEMYLRGTIEGPEDFPKLEDRRDGHVYKLELTADTKDPYVEGSSPVIPALATGDVIADPVTHLDPDNAGYCVIDGSQGVPTDLTADGILVGSKVIIDGDERFITAITSATNFTINTPLRSVSKDAVETDNTAFTVATVFDFVGAEAPSVYVDPSHADERSADYGKITGIGTVFTTEFKVADIVEIQGERRAIKSIDSDTEMVLESALNVAAITANNVAIYLVLEEGNVKEVKTGTVETDTVTFIAHSTYINTEYKIIHTSGNFVADGLVEGDKITIVKEKTPYERTLFNVATGTVLVDQVIPGDLSSIDTVGEAIGYFKSFDGKTFADGSDAFILWFNGSWVTLGVTA